MPRTSSHRDSTPPPAEAFAGARAVLEPHHELFTVTPTDLDAPAQAGPARPRAALHSNGDLEVERRADVASSLSTEAALTIGDEAHLRGNARAGGGAVVGERARIDGTLEVQGRLVWGDGARAGGVQLDGAFVTSDGLTRATKVRAAKGILPGGDSS